MARRPHETDRLYLPADAELCPLPDDLDLSPPRFFPPPTFASPDGLVCIGGRLTPEWLLDAYSHGIFPWPMSAEDPITWSSPNPRCIIELNEFHISRRLKRTLRSGKFRVTCNQDFEGVIRACASSREGGTWITPAMIEAYCRMHELGHAHSIEVWSERSSDLVGLQHSGVPAEVCHTAVVERPHRYLAGGTYGIAIGGLFAAESMFYRERDASKVALAYLVAHLRVRGYQLFDIQQWTLHTGSLGAREISRLEYLRRLAQCVRLPITFGTELAGDPVSMHPRDPGEKIW